VTTAGAEDVFTVEIGDRSFEIVRRGDTVLVDGDAVDASVEHVDGQTYSLLVGGTSHEFTIVRNGTTSTVTGISGTQHLAVYDRLASILRASGSEERHAHEIEVRAPMPGLVLKLEVEEGEEVHAGTGLVVLEAMKMENEIFASGRAVIERIHVKVGDAVTKGQLLATLA
jgi:biotin carboxyl carrier protein